VTVYFIFPPMDSWAMKTVKAEVNMAVPSSLSLPKPATNEEVRSKFLNMIGIESKLPQASSIGGASADSADSGCPSQTQPHCIVDPNWQHPRMQKVTCFTETLKYDRAADERYSPKRRKTEVIKTDRKPKKKRINFNETVEVVPIPMRTEYSNRVRARIWSTATEIYL
jgi:hypothetical protein